MENGPCNKKSFKGRKSALKFSKQNGWWVTNIADKIRAYYCVECKAWHNTSTIKGKRR